MIVSSLGFGLVIESPTAYLWTDTRLRRRKLPNIDTIYMGFGAVVALLRLQLSYFPHLYMRISIAMLRTST